MSADPALLAAPFDAGDLRLEPLTSAHREALRAICPADDPVWEIYPVHLAGEDFDPTFDAILADPLRMPFALFAREELVGTSSYLNVDPAGRALDIGGTYMTPTTRGTGLNGRIKPLLIDRALESGFETIIFRVDARNLRSQRAVEKLGAVKSAVMPRDRTTWTGFVRDTVVFTLGGDRWRSAPVHKEGVRP